MSEICDKLCGLILEGAYSMPLWLLSYIHAFMHTPIPRIQPTTPHPKTGKPELRDIYSIGLKTLIADVPEEVRGEFSFV